MLGKDEESRRTAQALEQLRSTPHKAFALIVGNRFTRRAWRENQLELVPDEAERRKIDMIVTQHGLFPPAVPIKDFGDYHRWLVVRIDTLDLIEDLRQIFKP